MRNLKKVIIVLIFLHQSIFKVMSCTTVSYADNNNKVWVIKSFDFHNGNGKLFINKKNVQKRSLALGGEGARWVSKYGSITFNQVARNYPFGGMNEVGLNMEILWLEETIYPPLLNKKNLINESQVIQYILDRAATVNEAIKLIKQIQIEQILAPVHYMICDSVNECSSIEFLDKKLIIHKMKQNNERILQNSAYSDLLLNIRSNGDIKKYHLRQNSKELNFIFNNQAAETEASFVKKSFQNLHILSQSNWSRWQIVYNLSDKKVWFKTIDSPYIKYASLEEYQLDCRKDNAEKVISLNSKLTGNIKEYLDLFSIDTNSVLLNVFPANKDLKQIVFDNTEVEQKCNTTLKND